SESIHDVMNLSDVLICDISSVMNDYLVTGKPIVLCNTQELTIESLNINFPTSCAATIVDEKTDFTEVIRKIEFEDKMHEHRLKLREYSLGNFESDPMTKFLRGLA
ncbi:MAG: hypothetical protein GYB35_15735, partial [Algicola sp.]|nr:hypothetical protein [Algicola sp.]